MKLCYVPKNFREETLAVIGIADQIISDYQDQGLNLTLRQLYYQFVAKDLIENTERSYKRLGKIINDARLAGLIDWEAIEDRTRALEVNLRLDSPRSAIELVRDQYGIDMWANQPRRVEVWIEKEALAGVVERVCQDNDVPFFSCRGYVSQSEQWRAGRRIRAQQRTVILHLGDHDPSGIDMTRDNAQRLLDFSDDNSEVKRIALNWDQIRLYRPPPNPTKVTDSRAKQYLRDFGRQSWELDALEPRVLTSLIQEHIDEHRDEALWAESKALLAEHMETLDAIIENLPGGAA